MAWAALAGAAGIGAGAGLGRWWWWDSRWPPRVYDRELARIGPPVRGALPRGKPGTSSGNVTGIDHPLVRAQWYVASGQLSALADEAAAHLAGNGYRLRTGPLEANYKGGQDGPPVTCGYELSWHVHGLRHPLAASVEFRFYSSEPLVPVSPDHPWLTYLAAEPVPPLVLSPDNGVVIVAVCRAHTDGL